MRTIGHVLVVDDDPDYLSTVRAMLADAGYAVDVSLSVGGALDLLWRAWEAQPDVILLDLHLPLLGGLTFAELYAVLPVRHAPLVLVTGVDESEARKNAHQMSAAGVLLKPFDLDELLACLERVRALAGASGREDALTAEAPPAEAPPMRRGQPTEPAA